MAAGVSQGPIGGALPMSRRGVMGAGLAAAAAALAPRAALAGTGAAQKADVTVIGAGLAGLNAARLLTGLGMRVIVLEAGTRLGGRVLTVDTADGPLDLGASEIGRSYGRVLDACRSLDLKLIAEDRDLLKFGALYQGRWIDNQSWDSNPLNRTVGDERQIPPMMMGSVLAARYNPLKAADNWLDPRFAEMDISLRALLQRHGHSPQAIALAGVSAPGIGIDETSVLRMWQEQTRSALDKQFGAAASGGLPATSNIVGGCAMLPRAMAAKLGDAVQLGKRVGRIEMSDTAATVTCSDGTAVHSRFVIAAIPFTMLAQVEIAARANPLAQRAIASMPYANTARLYLTVAKPFWQDDGLPPSFASDSPLGMFWAINNHTGAGRHRAMVVLVGKAGQAVANMDRDAAAAFLIGELARLRPASKGLVQVTGYKDWARDPLQRGCGFSLAPGQVNGFARDMLRPWAVMHFAGEHTRRVDFGMEAAMESGERAAIEISQRA